MSLPELSVHGTPQHTRLWSNSAAQLSQRAAPAIQTTDRAMSSIIDSLVNQLIPVRTQSASLSAPLRSGVIEAVVLANSPLLNTSAGEPQIRVSLGSGEQRLELTTAIPLPVGAKVQLKLSADNLAVLLKIEDPNVRANPTETSRSALGQALTVTTRTVAGDLQPLLTQTSSALNLSAPGTATAPGSGAFSEPQLILLQQRQSISNAVRQALPQQQPLRELLPVLQAVLQHAQPLPKPLVLAITQLVQQFPRPEQLQQAQPLKQALQNSGTFLESKLAQPAQEGLQRPGSQAPTADSGKTAEPINRDIKALIERILPQVQQLTPTTKEGADTGAPSSPLATSYSANLPFAAPISPAVSRNNHSASGRHNTEQSLDVLLRQLSRQLMASLARTQLNQLESIGNRQAFTNDPQSPINSWSLELPIMYGQRVENLDVRIEQREEQGAENSDKKAMLWTVMLNFDLHQLGRMQVQLNIIEKSVSATIWSQLRETHSQVQKHINELRDGLVKVGVQVKKVECHIGIPPTDRGQLYRQLVDLHT